MPQVVFKDHTPPDEVLTALPPLGLLPHPDLLRLHAAIGAVLHTSGAGQVISNIVAHTGTGSTLARGSDLFERIQHAELREAMQKIMTQV